MNSKLYIINKDTLVEEQEYILSLENVQCFLVDNFKGAIFQNQQELPFHLDISENIAPKINSVDFMVTIREKVDATARGPSDQIIQEANKDLGKIDNNSSPESPWELPKGFSELRGYNE